MTSETRTWRLTVKLPSGEPVVDLLLEAAALDAKPSEVPASPTPLRSAPSQSSNGDARMTDPQKRFLFRLLGAQGAQGKDAEAHLKQYFKVANLRDISKTAASEYINQLANDRKDAHGT